MLLLALYLLAYGRSGQDCLWAPRFLRKLNLLAKKGPLPHCHFCAQKRQVFKRNLSTANREIEMALNERVKTGIPGLDSLIGGGFPKGRIILVSGACGTGKSILAMEFAYKGALEYNEPAVFVTFDEMPEKIREDCLNFGWDLEALERKKKFALVDATSARVGAPSDEEHAILPGQMDIDRIIVDIMTVAKNIGAKRIVIDSIPAMAFKIDNPTEIRRAILKLAYITSRAGLTTIMTTEIEEQNLAIAPSFKFSKYDIEEYVADGVILLSFIGAGRDMIRTAYVRKMRGTKHSMEIHPIEINSDGVTVKKLSDVLKI